MKYICLVLLVLSQWKAGAQIPKEKSLLWSVSGKGMKHPSYLFGTFHLLCAGDFSIPDTVRALIGRSKKLFLEVDIDDPKMVSKMMKGIAMRKDTTLKTLLSKADYDSSSLIFQTKVHIPLMMVHSYKPMLLTSLLYPAMLGCTPIEFEKELAKLAKKDSVRIEGLETIEDQLRIFDEIPYPIQAKMFLHTVYTIDSAAKDFEQTAKLYLSKDIDALQKSIGEDAELGKYENTLVNRRNRNWIPVIEKNVAKSSCFFAVGAGHLGGAHGLIALLRKAGYTVKPVMIP